jgi:hypothetical protein
MPVRRMDSKRVANQAILRSVNDRIRDLNESFADTLGVDPHFICECSDLSCATPISVAIEDYRRVRQNETQFIVAPGHVEFELANVVQAKGSYVIVAVREDLVAS